MLTKGTSFSLSIFLELDRIKIFSESFRITEWQSFLTNSSSDADATLSDIEYIFKNSLFQRIFLQMTMLLITYSVLENI